MHDQALEAAMTTPQTANPAWGFFGTIRHHAEPADAWNQALSAIAAATDCPTTAVRAFLDRRAAFRRRRRRRNGARAFAGYGDQSGGGPLDGLADQPQDRTRHGHSPRAA